MIKSCGPKMAEPTINSFQNNYNSNDNIKTYDNLPLNLKIILDEFRKSKNTEDEILLDHYLRGYFELNKFFPLLGTVFNFISGDVAKKITILKTYRQGNDSEKYVTIQSMVKHEKEINFPSNSATRTLLRLHRALEFTAAFLEALKSADYEDKLGPVCSEIYHQTLAKYHGWLLSKTVGAVFLLFPTKQQIIDRVTVGSDKSVEENEILLSQIIEIMKSVHSVTQKFYEDNNILDLP